MNKINQLFQENKDNKLLSLYFCAGSPTLDGTADVILTLQRRGISMIEVGIPFSDPMADGPVIQDAATRSLKNGMTLQLLFDQLRAIKDDAIPYPQILNSQAVASELYGIDAIPELILFAPDGTILVRGNNRMDAIEQKLAEVFPE